MKRFWYAVMLLALVVGLSGCGMKEAVKKMSFELVGVNVRGMTPEGFDATVRLKVNNPNGFGMTVTDVSYRAYVSGREVATGRTDSEVEIPAGGSCVAELPVRVEYGEFRDSLMDLVAGRFGYRVTGEVGFKTWFGRYSVPFDTVKGPVKGGEVLEL